MSPGMVGVNHPPLTREPIHLQLCSHKLGNPTTNALFYKTPPSRESVRRGCKMYNAATSAMPYNSSESYVQILRLSDGGNYCRSNLQSTSSIYVKL